MSYPYGLELQGHGGAGRLHGGAAAAVRLERGEAHLEAEAVVSAGRAHGSGHAGDGGALHSLQGGIVALEGGLQGGKDDGERGRRTCSRVSDRFVRLRRRGSRKHSLPGYRRAIRLLVFRENNNDSGAVRGSGVGRPIRKTLI